MSEGTIILNKQSSTNVVVTSTVLPTGAATSANQLTIESLVETLQELSIRLSAISSVIQHGTSSLRVTGMSMPSTAVTGPITSAQYVAAELTDKIARSNLTATIANINNCTGA